MSTMDRRIERLEQQSHPNRCEVWCCASEADAKALIARLRTEGTPPPLVFIAGKSNSDGSPVWRIEGERVADLWRAVDSMSPAFQQQEIGSTTIDRRFEAMTDEQLLGVIAEGGSTLVLYADGNNRFLEAGQRL